MMQLTESSAAPTADLHQIPWYGCFGIKPLALRAIEAGLVCRSDLALVCSPVELELLQSRYQVPACKLQLAPFFVDLPDGETPPFSARQHFMTIGNFRFGGVVIAAGPMTLVFYCVSFH